MRQPEGYGNGTSHICLLIKILYSLKQASREWNIELDTKLQQRGYVHLRSDPCVYIWQVGEDFAIITVWVDDLLLFATTVILIEKMKTDIKSEWEVTDLGDLKKIIRIEITMGEDLITISSRKYIESILLKEGLGLADWVTTPLDPNVPIVLNPEGNVGDRSNSYARLLGEVQYIANTTHPDIQYCYDPPQFFSSLSDPLLVTLSMPKRPLPLNPSSLPDLPPLPPSEPSKPSSPLDQPPVEPLVPVPWNIHCREYSSMEMYQEPPPVENPLEDPDSPMEDAPPLEPEPFIPYEPDVPGGNMHALSPEESPVIPWQEYLAPDSPVSRKHSLSPTSPSSVPIRQRTSREGSYQSITPSASSPIAGTSPQSQGYQSNSPGGSADNPSSTQSSADDADSDMALNWVTINTDYLKG